MIRAILLENPFFAPRIQEEVSGECYVSFLAPADEGTSGEVLCARHQCSSIFTALDACWVAAATMPWALSSQSG